MNDIKNRFIKSFKEIAKLPHPSGHTGELKKYIYDRAQSLGFEAIDDGENLIVKIPATPDCSDLSPVIIQCHMDMVALVKPGSKHDFLVDGLEVSVSEDNKYLSALNTSLGGDDGFAIAYMLMMMEDDFSHPPLYFVLTADEEIGCLGAKDLNFKTIDDAKYMINLDSEYEGFMPIASAAGERITTLNEFSTQESLGTAWDLGIFFSGDSHPVSAIDQNGIEPAKLLAQILSYLLSKTNSRLVFLESLNKPGTISNYAVGRIVTLSDDETIIKELRDIEASILTAYSELGFDIMIPIPIKIGTQKVLAYSQADSVLICHNEAYLPTGVLIRENSQPVASIALVSCSIDSEQCENVFQIRGKNAAVTEFLKNRILQYFTYAKTYCAYNIDALSWQAKDNSPFLERAERVWKDNMTGELTKRYAHGFLETGIFQNALPELDIISMGATVEKIHSTDERIDLNSAVRVYNYLKALLSDFSPVEKSDPAVIERLDGETESIQDFYANRSTGVSEDCEKNCPFESSDT